MPHVLDTTLSRRRFLHRLALAGVGGAGLYLVGCGDDDDESAAPATNQATEREDAAAPAGDTEPMGTEFALVDGWFRGERVRYYDFGMQTALAAGGPAVRTAPIYAFITGVGDDGAPQFLEGQHNIVDAVPGDADYSDLWEVMLVTAPADYTPDSIRSRAALEAAGYETTPAGLFVNCPVVPAGSTLEGGEPLTQGWHRDGAVFYPDFGPNPALAIPIWAFVTGFDEAGAPQFVAGQQNIIDAVPGDAAYSAFWRVNLVMVDAGYEPNSVRAAADVLAGDFEVVQTDLVVNCPVTEF